MTYNMPGSSVLAAQAFAAALQAQTQHLPSCRPPPRQADFVLQLRLPQPTVLLEFGLVSSAAAGM